MLKVLLGAIFCFFTAAYANENYIVIRAKDFTLNLYDGQETLLKVYKVGLAQNGMGKTKEGDKKTPLGEYRLIWKASCFYREDGGWPIAKDKGYIGFDNNYAYEPRPGFNDGSLFSDDYGGDQGVFCCLDYPNASDIAKGYTGFGIAIHASLRGGLGEFSSRGCIRMNPQDARDLYKRIKVGAKVIITL